MSDHHRMSTVARFSTRRGNPTVEVEVVLEDGSLRPRGGAFGRFDRRFRGRASCATATRAATWARACSQAVDHVNNEMRRRRRGPRRLRPARRRCRA